MQLKVVSLNLWHGGLLAPAPYDFLAEQQADIVALQEVYDAHDPNLPEQYRTMETLQARLGYPFQQFAEMYKLEDKGVKLPFGIAILSRFPIKPQTIDFLVESTRDVYQDVPDQWSLVPRILQGVELETPVGTVDFFNIHGVWDPNGDDYSPARQRMSEIMLRAIKGRAKVILTGDTNAQSSNQALRNLETQLKPALDPPPQTTFNMRRKDNPGYATAAVDLMYVSPEIGVVSATCQDVDISDHLPLVVTLEIN